MVYRRFYRSLDHTLLIAAACLVLFSLITIGSATLEFTDGSYSQLKNLSILTRLMHLDFEYVIKQFIWVLLGLVGMIFIMYIPYEDLGKHARGLYIINLLMLLTVMFVGSTALGAQRWIQIGPFQFQPSEFSKIILIITFAAFLVKREGKLNTLRDLFPCFVHIGVPMLLILKQPDLGTSLVLMAIMFGMLFAAGARPALLAGIIGTGLLLGVTLFVGHSYLHHHELGLQKSMENVTEAITALQDNKTDLGPLLEDKQTLADMKRKGYSSSKSQDLQKYYDQLEKNYAPAHKRHELFHKFTLKEYQMTRLIIFTDPKSDLLGSGYHVWQSRIAIGSGGLAGKGFLGGTQSHLTFLPIRHTDFIFSVVGEEFGFIGSAVLLSLFFVILYRGVQAAAQAKDSFGTLLATGIVSMFTFHILVNVGMTAGIMPVTGIPLPFFSYGGSNMIMNLAALGLLLNVYMRRQKIMF